MPPTSKLPITRAERDVHAAVVELKHLLAKLTRLTEEQDIQIRALEEVLKSEVEELWHVVKEVNYRNLFAMQYFKFKKKTPTTMLDAFGQPIMDETEITLWDVYESQRETFIEKVELNLAARRIAEDAEAAASSTIASGSAVDPQTPDAGTERADETLARAEDEFGKADRSPLTGKFGAH